MNLYADLWARWRGDFEGTRSVQASLKQNRWNGLKEVIDTFNCNTVLEFGSGLSTALLDRSGLIVHSFETDEKYLEKVRKFLGETSVRTYLWDNKELNQNLMHYDLALVDGETPRRPQAELAFQHADVVVVDDLGASSRGFDDLYKDWVKLDIGPPIMGVFMRPKENRGLSVVISHRNELVMLGVTVRSILEDLLALDIPSEIVIVDNSDREIQVGVPHVVNGWWQKNGFVKRINQSFPNLFTARDTGVDEASYEYVAFMDAHMLAGREMFKDLVGFLDSNYHLPIGLAHAPLAYVNRGEPNNRHEFRTGRLYDKPSLNGVKGVPFACKKTMWQEIGGYGFLSKHRFAWGGGDIYISLKPWFFGYENWAVPCRPGIHIGPFPRLPQPHRYRQWTASGNFKTYFGAMVLSYVFGEDDYPNRLTKLGNERFMQSFNNGDWELAKQLGAEEREWISQQKYDLDYVCTKVSQLHES